MTDLTDRMRTCAAAIKARLHDAPMPTEHLLDDTADLLIEAADLLEPAGDPLGEPVQLLEPVPDRTLGGNNDEAYRSKPPGAWVTGLDTLPGPPGPPSPRTVWTCPKCDSRAQKRAWRNGTELYLACPVCSHTWPYK